MEFSEDADAKASWEVFYPLEAFLILHFINHQKGGLKGRKKVNSEKVSEEQ